jgi:hypothetical protein
MLCCEISVKINFYFSLEIIKERIAVRLLNKMEESLRIHYITAEIKPTISPLTPHKVYELVNQPH